MKKITSVWDERIRKYFRITRGADNLPIVAHAKTGEAGGRLQIAKMLGAFGVKTGIEVGTQYGLSAVMWCEGIPGLKLVCVDSYSRERSEPYGHAKELSEKYGYELLKMTSMEAVDRFENGSVDFVHIDGDHYFDTCVQDIVRYSLKVKIGGLVIIHDYVPFKQNGVIKAVDAYTESHRIDPWYLTEPDMTVMWERGIERC